MPDRCQKKLDLTRIWVHKGAMPLEARPTLRKCPWKIDRWMLEGLRDAQGRRFRRFFQSKERASAELALYREKANQSGRAGLALNDAQRADAVDALNILEPFPKVTLTDAARHLADSLRRLEKTVPVSELISLFLDAKKADGRSDIYLVDLRSRLSEFARSFGGTLAAAVTTQDLDDWLRALPLSPQSRVNFRRVLHALFNFALVSNFVRENPVTKTSRPKVVAKEPGILTPAQLSALLEAAPAILRPALAIGAFAGLRPAEIHRLTWDAINLEERFVSVSAKTSKTASRRLVSISDNLLSWLLQAPNRTGLVAPDNERKLFLAAREAAGIKTWPADALRHSWVTYRFALTGDAARTAAEAGHDQAVLHRHYRALATRAEGERWFAILPAGQDVKTVAFEPAAAQA